MSILGYLTSLLRTRYALPIYSSEPNCRELNVEQEPKPENQPIIDPFTAMVEADLELSIIVEPDVFNEPE